MKKFNNEVYQPLATDLTGDTFYLENRSNTGKISSIRQYTEIIVRRILNYPQGKKLTIGNKKIQSKLKEYSSNPLLRDSIEIILSNGNSRSHTQVVKPPTDEDVKKVIDALFKLYAFLLVDYFEKYEFGSNDEVMTSFSILPPIIRWFTLDSLFKQDETNAAVIDKLVLATLKAYDKETALNWVEDNKDLLSNLPIIKDSDDIKEIMESVGVEYLPMFMNKTMYDDCIEKIDSISHQIEQAGILYTNFEEAIDFYKENGKIDGNSEEITEFNSIMEFLYLGRKSILSENKKNWGK
ncbi:hypothetical protein SMULJ23_0789 [Streptococcus mutans LJ23]|uniref:hypothetical protein n=2 Tax=Streptococcus mutans TaxID=1309 RepID=UPI000264EF09|nr:hypothetical protein [Streptococcus mutans]BAL69123.1 hypothetical protein SMULJ23_0789 [Streptococcus mutans LJ23]